MKKALKINLSGQIFHIDEDAYEKLKNYLDTISSHFSDAQESKEIISDIENRIAELFMDKMKDGNEVITIKEVDEIIEIMGKPEEIVNEEEESEAKGSHRRNQRRLYRDPDNAVIGGVCSGLGAYFNVDTLIFRILFIVLVLIGWGLPILLYIILWIAVPKAVTAAEKLEMRGEKVNVSNIERTIREEYDNVKENFKKARGSEAFKRTEGFLTELLRVLGVIIVAFIKIFLVIVAIVFIIAGIGILTGIIALFFFGTQVLPFEVFNSIHPDFVPPFINPVNMSILALSLIVLILIPILTIVYGLFKVLFKFRGKDKALGLSAFALWILALISAIGIIVFEAKNFAGQDSISHSSVINEVGGSSLTISMDMNSAVKDREKGSFTIDDTQYFILKDGKITGTAKVDIEKASDDKYEIRITKSARGLNEETSIESAESISYSYTATANELFLSPCFSITDEEKWRMQQLMITVYIPLGDTVILDKNLRDHLEGVKNISSYSSKRMAGNTWVMKEEGLELIEGK